MPIAVPEDLTIRAFIVRERRERFLELLAHPKRRKKITDSLAHPNPAWFDGRFVKQIPPAQKSANSIAKLLRAKGAGPTCWVISEEQTIDAREWSLIPFFAISLAAVWEPFFAAFRGNSPLLRVRTEDLSSKNDIVPSKSRRTQCSLQLKAFDLRSRINDERPNDAFLPNHR